jgi:hypothetical protein
MGNHNGECLLMDTNRTMLLSTKRILSDDGWSTRSKWSRTTTTPTSFPVPQGPRFQLHLITHDESIFTANDRQKTKWTHEELDSNPEQKGKGALVMVSDFLVPEWGRLKDEDGE